MPTPLLRLYLFALLAAAVPAVTAQSTDEPAEDFVYVAPTRPDRIGRIMAPVMINGRGPYAFIVDTGASRSANISKSCGTSRVARPGPLRIWSSYSGLRSPSSALWTRLPTSMCKTDFVAARCSFTEWRSTASPAMRTR